METYKIGVSGGILHNKLTEARKQLVKVDKWFPSSKTCSVCGKKKEELALSERVYICDCGNVMDRDQNAAINIRQEALRHSLKTDINRGAHGGLDHEDIKVLTYPIWVRDMPIYPLLF